METAKATNENEKAVKKRQGDMTLKESEICLSEMFSGHYEQMLKELDENGTGAYCHCCECSSLISKFVGSPLKISASHINELQSELCPQKCKSTHARLLVLLFFSSDSQSSFRIIFLKLVQQSAWHTIVSELCALLRSYLSLASVIRETQCFAAFTIAQCLRCHNVGPRLVMSDCDTIIRFFIDALQTHYSYLKQSGGATGIITPLEQQEAYNGLHLLCQTIVTVLQILRQYDSYSVSNSLQELVKLLNVLLSEPPAHLPCNTQHAIATALILHQIRTGRAKESTDNITYFICNWLVQNSCKRTSMLTNMEAQIAVNFCHAFLTTVSAKELILPLPVTMQPHFTPSKTILEALFFHLESVIASRSEPQLLLTGCRTLESLGKILATTRCIDILSSFLVHIVESCFTYLEHSMSSIRQAAKNFLDSLLQTMKDDQDMVSGVVDVIRGLPMDRSARFLAITSLSKHLGTERVLREFPDLVDSQWLFNGAKAFNTKHLACRALELLMQTHKSVGDQVWCEHWVIPLLEHMPCARLEPVLASAVVCRPKATLSIVHSWCSTTKTCPRLKLLFNCLLVVKKCNQLQVVRQNIQWAEFVSTDEMWTAATHSDDHLRLAVMAVIVEGRKSCEPIQPDHLRLLLSIIERCSDTYATSVQHQTLALSKKLIARLQLSARNLSKECGGSTEPYVDFVTHLCTLSYQNLSVGSHLIRRTIALQILSQIATSPEWSLVWRDTMFVAENVRVLQSCLWDSYECNKQLAAQLLSAYPAELLGLQDEECMSQVVENCIRLAESYKPTDSVTAAYVLAMYMDAMETHKLKTLDRFHLCSLLKQRLCEQYRMARRSIMYAAIQGPMYGTVLCLKHLLAGLKICDGNREKWRLFVHELIELCFELDAVTTPIVNSCSPEGHLPVNCEEDLDSAKVTPQMVLLCSWRTVKEVSLLLGDLVNKTPPCDALTTNNLLSNSQLIAIGEHLTSLLCQIKHRGAFEQPYIGFTKLCSWLWQVPHGELPLLPSKWLQELLQAIKSSKVEGNSTSTLRLSSELCATRRSAGVPFIVQALLTTELEVRSPPRCFQATLTELLTLAEQSGAESQIHALNILRSLFRCAQLGDHIAPYVSRGFEIALRAYKGSSWAERNAATLLFSALMNRVFGVKHTPGLQDVPRKNLMTGRMFFRLYPNLYGLLSRELETCAKLMEQKGGGQLTPSLQPTLLLLTRLYPSSLEGTDTSFNLFSLRDSVVICAKSPCLATRELAAKALVPLIDDGCIAEFMTISLSVERNQSHNKLHGTLLQLTRLTQNTGQIPLHVLGDKLYEGIYLLEKSHACDITKTAYLNFVHACLQHHPTVFSDDSVLTLTLRHKILQILQTPASIIGYGVLKQKAAKILLRLAAKERECVRQLLQFTLSHPLAGVVHEALLFVIQATEGKDPDKISGDAYEILSLPLKGERIEVAYDFGDSSTIVPALQRFLVSCIWEGQNVELEVKTCLLLALSRLSTPILNQCGDPNAMVQMLIAGEASNKFASASHMLLALCGELVHSHAFSMSVVQSYAQALLRRSSRDMHDSYALVVAQSLCRNRHLLLHAHPEIVSTALTAILSLLERGSDQVRATVIQFHPTLHEDSRSNAITGLCRLLAEHVKNLQIQMVTLLYWALGDLLLPQIDAGIVSVSEELDAEQERVFENEDFGHEFIVTRQVCEHLKKISTSESSELWQKPLEWLPIPDLSSSLPSHCTTLQSLLDTARHQCNMQPHFLHPQYARSRLNWLKWTCLQDTGILQLMDNGPP